MLISIDILFILDDTKYALIGPIEDREDIVRTGFYDVNVSGQHYPNKFDEKKIVKGHSKGYFVRKENVV